MIRLYFNKHGALPWSIDDGDQANERQFAMVYIGRVKAYTMTRKLNPDEDPIKVPSAWIQFEEATLTITIEGRVATIQM